MLAYLEKFNKLPQALRNKVTSPAVMANLTELEKRYKVNLAVLVMKIMVKDVNFGNLSDYLKFEFKLNESQGQQLAEEMKNKIFKEVLNYLTQAATAVVSAPKPVAAPPRVKAAAAVSPLTSASKAGSVGQPAEKIFKPQASQAKVASASFYFSPEDEEEIRELAGKIGDISAAAKEEIIERKLNKIIEDAKINFGSTGLLERFKQILKTYLRGIRDRLEVKQTLIKSFDLGGLSFDNDSAEKVMVLAENIINLPDVPAAKPMQAKKSIPGLAEEKKQAVASLKNIGARDFEYDLASLAKRQDKKQETAAVKPAAKLDTDHELAPPTPALLPGQAPKIKVSSEKKTEPEKTTIQAQSQPVKIKNITRAQLEPENKVKIEDVKFVPRIMGPIEEFAYLDIINFRRLDKEPRQAAAKLQEKINLLEEENYTKKLEAIKAWRGSPLNKLYLEIGGLSISGGKAINVIIEERKRAGKDYLSSEEFEAIMDFNKALRF